jgi:two-component sensor histidine kinase/plasmid stabilization system protein ParE
MSSDAGSPAVEGRRVLFIDDDPGFARLATRALARHGFQCTHAASGPEGLAHLAREVFDAITLDHVMPGMGGPQTLEEICKTEAPPPVIYVTGADEGRIAVNALKAGAADYIVKDPGPDFFELLARTIEQAVEAQQLRRESRAQAAEVAAARDRAEMLLKEVNHRVANSLALVSSLAHLQAKALADSEARDALLAFQRRVLAVAQVHRRLYTSCDVSHVQLDQYLEGLVDELRTSFAGQCNVDAIRLEAGPMQLPTDQAIWLGVIVTELVSNACKYAYPQDLRGEVRIRLEPAGETSPRLLVEDDGVGLKAGAPTGTALGTRIVAAMARSLGARLETAEAPRGTRLILHLPR